jgi:hypothetical protein
LEILQSRSFRKWLRAKRLFVLSELHIFENGIACKGTWLEGCEARHGRHRQWHCAASFGDADGGGQAH